MDPKSTVVKSKSSNSAISKKSKEDTSRPYNKKTRSNANVPHHALKKRGVYVEKRLTNINLLNNGKEVDYTPKPPPRPRPGQKRFLASVLNILSKSTTGTQYPEINDDNRKCRGTNKNKFYAQRNKNDDDNIVNKENISINSKEKFKSRVLNKKFVREDKKKMVVLQSKKEIAQTPSNYSEWSYKDTSQNSNVSNLMIYDDSNKAGGSHIAEELKNAVLEGRNVTVKKLRYLKDEPKTLVSEGPKDQKNLYNFFVDLLETTISVYNVKAQYDVTGPTDVSKTNLVINESVAKKLNVDKSRKAVEFDDEDLTPECPYTIQNFEDHESNFVNMRTKPITIKREGGLKPAKARTLNTDSFLYSNNAKRIPQKSRSVEIRRRTMFKNKSDLINVLKQELQLTQSTFEEPRSIFQALRVMARNKKKISFDASVDDKAFNDECYLKRRKIISSRKLRKNNGKVPLNNHWRPDKPKLNHSDYLRSPMHTTPALVDRRDSSETYGTESYHSLEVYGFDYEPKSIKRPYVRRTRDLTFMYHSSPSNSDLDFEIQDVILNSPSILSSIRKSSAVVD